MIPMKFIFYTKQEKVFSSLGRVPKDRGGLDSAHPVCPKGPLRGIPFSSCVGVAIVGMSNH